MSKKIPRIEDDEKIREIIIDIIYDYYKNAKGPEKAKINYTTLKKLVNRWVREKYNAKIEDNKLFYNLEYLKQNGWIVVERREISLKDGRKRFVEYYKPSKLLIDLKEGTNSKFYRNINLDNFINKLVASNSIVIVGNNNFVSNVSITSDITHKEIYEIAEQLKEYIIVSKDLSEEDILKALKYLNILQETLKTRIGNEDKNILNKIKEFLEYLKNKISDTIVANLIERLISYIIKLLGI